MGSILTRRLLCLIFVVMPMRNAHYFDAMEFLDRYKHDIYRGLEVEKRELAVHDMMSQVADRSVAAEIDTLKRTFGCLHCQRTFQAPVAYLCHKCECTPPSHQEKEKDEIVKTADDRETQRNEADSRCRS